MKMATAFVTINNMIDAAFKRTTLLIFVLGSIGFGSGFDNYYDEYYDADAEPLSFLARPQTFTVEVGQSVIIPCDVDNIGHHKLVVKKRGPGDVEQLLWVGREKMARSRRLTMDLETKRLTVTHVRRQDAGTYVCHFDTSPPKELHHILVVQYSPKVSPTVPTEHQVKAGDKAVLACKAEGNPKPIIRWSRQEGHLPNGQSQQEGDILHLEKVDRHSEGTYVCTADNGIGPPASAKMTVIVEYAPEISPEKEVIRTGEGDRVLLVCLVYGRPVPRVVWTHNGNPVKPEIGVEVNTPKSTQTGSYQRSSDAHSNELNTAHRHMLKLNHVTEEDFGSYVCIAENIYGETTAAIQITGLPQPPQVISSPHAGKVHSYSLMWQTESYYPITELMVKYRKTETNPNTVVPIEWETVSELIELPAATSDNKVHVLTYELGNLEIAQDYMATVRVRNKYGWSAESQPFDFSTQKGRQMAIQQTTPSRAKRWSWDFICFWAALFYFLIGIWLCQTT